MAHGTIKDTKGNTYSCNIVQFNFKHRLHTAEELPAKPALVDELVAIGFSGLQLIEAAPAQPDGNAAGEVKPEDMTAAQLKELLTEKSIPFKNNANKATLLQLLADAEATTEENPAEQTTEQ